MTKFSATMVALIVMSTACTGELGLDGNNGGGTGIDDAGLLPDGARVGGDSGTLPDGGTVDPDAAIEQCMTPLAVFERETWPKAGKAVCAGCHLAGGVAETDGSTFLLKSEDALTVEGMTLDEFYTYNLDQFRAHAIDEGGIPKFIAKATAAIPHNGGNIAPADSAALQALQALALSFETEGDETCVEPPEIDPIAEVALLSPEATLRKASMMLAGRLPTAGERNALGGLSGVAATDALEAQLDSVMQGDRYHEWLKVAWNDVFMFRGLWELDVTFDFMVVSQQDFRAREWGYIGRNNFTCDVPWDGMPVWQRFGYESQEVCENNQFGRNYLGQRVAWSLMEAPLELIAWLVESDRPFSEILTTDVVMMNYYSSIAYFGSALPADNPWVAQYLDGVPLDTVAHPAGSTIESIDLPYLHEFQPMTTMRRTRVVNPGAGLPLEWEYLTPAEYARAGLLTDQLWLTRYPTTDTNVNRHRTWSFMLNFLGVDILALADRRGDPAEAELNSDQPTIDDPNCNVCHNVMDPVAGLFQDFWVDAQYIPNRAWPPNDQPNMLGPGISIIGPNAGTSYDPDANSLTPIEWLGAETVQDPRFAARMVRHAFMQLTGHEPMEPPTDSAADGWRGRVRAYEVEAAFLSQLRENFVATDFNMRELYKDIIVSPWFRASGLADPAAADDADRYAATESFGDGDQLLTPFELHRKIEAVLGRSWQFAGWQMRGTNLNVIDQNAPANDFLLRFNSENDFRYVDQIFRDMYGGIDFLNNTARLTLPSSVMSAAARRVSNELACGAVATEFGPTQTRSSLFSGVQPGDASADNPLVVDAIRRLHVRMLGQLDPTDAEIAPTVALYDQVLSQGQDALSVGAAEVALPPHCSTADISEDPTYGIRAWMAVMSYLALDPAFLYTW